eukprot:4544781-Pyramimonas_sp.AAC.1
MVPTYCTLAGSLRGSAPSGSNRNTRDSPFVRLVTMTGAPPGVRNMASALCDRSYAGHCHTAERASLRCPSVVMFSLDFPDDTPARDGCSPRSSHRSSYSAAIDA